MTTIIDGKKIQKEILKRVEEEVASLPFQPVFCDILVGNDPVSLSYVKMKMRTAEKAGIRFHKAFFPESINTEDLIKEIEKLNKIPNMCGIIIQLPLPSHIDKQQALDAIDSTLDVDCLGTSSGERFYGGDTELGFPTALACMKVLDSISLPLGEKSITVLGQGALVGRPVTALLRFRGLNPKTMNSKTENKDEIIKNSDVIICAIGRGQYIKGHMIKKGAVLIDAGTSESEGGIIGDVDSGSVLGVASYVSPVPGGVGPVTVAILLENVLKVAKMISQKQR